MTARPLRLVGRRERTAALSKPAASAAVDGISTSMPGMWAKLDSRVWA